MSSPAASAKRAAKRFVLKLAVALTGSVAAQQLLARAVARLQFLMGIGSGGDVGSSGESVVVDLVRARANNGNSGNGGAPLVVFDVGANVGDYTALALPRLNGLPVRVHAFEPAATAFAALSARFAGEPAVALNRLALADDSGLGVLFADRPGSGIAALGPRQLGAWGVDHAAHAEPVDKTTVDLYCAERNIARIDLLKLDVEGWELKVLQGARGMFARGAVDVTVFEFGGTDIDTRVFLRDFVDFFGEFGMTLFRLTPAGTLVPLGRYRESVEQFRTTNYVAFRG